MSQKKVPMNKANGYPPGTCVAVQLPLPISGAYDYRVGEQFSVKDGDFVRVPLGPRLAIGVVWGPAIGDVAENKIKEITALLDCPPLPEISRRFVDWTANYTLQAKGSVLKMAMSVRDALDPPKPVAAYILAPDPPEFRITPARQRILDVLADGPPRTTTDLALEAATGPGVVKGLEIFWMICPMMGITFWLGLFWRRTTVAGAWASCFTALY